MVGAVKIITKDGAFQQGEQAKLQAAVNTASATSFLLHFHGGVTDLAQGTANADFVYPLLYQLTEQTAAPIFFCWQSGPADVLARIKSLDTSRDVQELIATAERWLAKKQREANLNANLFNAQINPAGVNEQALRADAAAFLHNDVQFQSYMSGLSARLQTQAGVDSLEGFDPSLRSAFAINAQGPQALGATHAMGVGVVVEILVNLAFRYFIDHRDHGNTTVVEEVLRGISADLIGKYFWGGMKTIALNHFAASGGQPSTAQTVLDMVVKKGARRIIVVGHSAGTILALQFLDAAQAIDPTIRVDALLLAPAARMDFAAPLLPKLRANSKLRSFMMTDTDEEHDKLDNTLPGNIFQRSILYFVSGIAENREGANKADAMVLGMQRHFNLDDKVLNKHERKTRAAINAFMQTGQRIKIATGVKHHTKFEADPATQQDIKNFITDSPWV